jgi:hypothetical protein
MLVQILRLRAQPPLGRETVFNEHPLTGAWHWVGGQPAELPAVAADAAT